MQSEIQIRYDGNSEKIKFAKEKKNKSRKGKVFVDCPSGKEKRRRKKARFVLQERRIRVEQEFFALYYHTALGLTSARLRQ